MSELQKNQNPLTLIHPLPKQQDSRQNESVIMAKKNYETSELKELKDALQTFTEFVWEMEEYLPEFYHFFDTMRQNIEIFLQVGGEDEEQIHEILERDWEKAHAPLVGVQCYDFQGSHPEAEAGTCVYFANLLTEIGRFFEPMSMLGVL